MTSVIVVLPMVLVTPLIFFHRGDNFIVLVVQIYIVLSMEPYRFIFKVTAQEVITLWNVERCLFGAILGTRLINLPWSNLKQNQKSKLHLVIP